MAYDPVKHFPDKASARESLGDSTPGTFVRRTSCYEGHDWYRPYCYVAGVSDKADRYVRADGVTR